MATPKHTSKLTQEVPDVIYLPLVRSGPLSVKLIQEEFDTRGRDFKKDSESILVEVCDRAIAQRYLLYVQETSDLLKEHTTEEIFGTSNGQDDDTEEFTLVLRADRRPSLSSLSWTDLRAVDFVGHMKTLHIVIMLNATFDNYPEFLEWYRPAALCTFLYLAKNLSQVYFSVASERLLPSSGAGSEQTFPAPKAYRFCASAGSSFKADAIKTCTNAVRQGLGRVQIAYLTPIEALQSRAARECEGYICADELRRITAIENEDEIENV